jgi:hypothetical protein
MEADSSPASQPHDPGPRSLAELEARFARDMELLTLPPAKAWLEPRAHPELGPVLDVAIVGAGMAGLAAAFALKCLGVRNMSVFDRAPKGSRSGPGSRRSSAAPHGRSSTAFRGCSGWITCAGTGR